MPSIQLPFVFISHRNLTSTYSIAEILHFVNRWVGNIKDEEVRVKFKICKFIKVFTSLSFYAIIVTNREMW